MQVVLGLAKKSTFKGNNKKNSGSIVRVGKTSQILVFDRDQIRTLHHPTVINNRQMLKKSNWVNSILSFFKHK